MTDQELTDAESRSIYRASLFNDMSPIDAVNCPRCGYYRWLRMCHTEDGWLVGCLNCWHRAHDVSATEDGAVAQWNGEAKWR